MKKLVPISGAADVLGVLVAHKDRLHGVKQAVEEASTWAFPQWQPFLLEKRLQDQDRTPL